jgi:hypothetical protein
MEEMQSRPGKTPMERLDLALMAVLACCVVLAAVVVGGLQERTSQGTASSTSFVAR